MTTRPPESLEPMPYLSSPSKKSPWIPLIISAIILVTITAFVVVTNPQGYLFQSKEPSLTPQPQWELNSPCGNSTIEARKNNCQFDFITYAWLPEDCVDAESNDEYRRWMNESSRIRGSFPLFKDQEGNEQIRDEEELSERIGKSVFITREAHWAHCLMMFRKLPRAHDKGTAVDRTAANMGHTKHCTNIILNIDKDPIFNASNSLDHLDHVYVGFGFCVRLGYQDLWQSKKSNS
ncbi:hypothetical protein V501_01327 [Pseudogymnoascus sp. VKM F-4519 (FW-2642)]|nr:hypothetical protein V501_01327 [Pseudogymnoascus sp. VKM F-4519 (FW-2642)]